MEVIGSIIVHYTQKDTFLTAQDIFNMIMVSVIDGRYL